MSSKKEADGYLLVDHRNSPGLPNEHTRRLGLPDGCMGEGTVYEGRTHGCPHCGAPSLITRVERNWCRSCDLYICDYCEKARHLPGYEHFTMREVAEKFMTGKYHIMGTAHGPRLIPLDAIGATQPPPVVELKTEDHGIRRL